MKREQKITVGEMRASGLRRLLVYCGDYEPAVKYRPSVEIRQDWNRGRECRF